MNHAWNSLDMSMEDQILHHHDQLPFNSIWPSCPPQTQIPASIQPPISTFLSDRVCSNTEEEEEEDPEEELGAMKEMMYRIAAMQPVEIDPATIRKPKRRNVRISDDPQSVAARLRRERISEKIRILQRLVPGGRKMDTASMLEEAIRYVKFLKRQIRLLQPDHHQQQQHQPCSTINGDWQIPYSNKPLDHSTTTASSLLDTRAGGLGYILGGNTGGNPLCFNHEVISD
ncbi:hypothetical protein OIU84_006529 [Salix udensis]|uniref:BHLH domain-containing protein n=1 Tax=Salix udensis TaxID=889485 RepID=A0AAD6K0V4_9ROSI|nr:hypothetical protein OIU84_006529 [Salix udensis]